MTRALLYPCAAVVLGVDPGRVSGWAVVAPDGPDAVLLAAGCGEGGEAEAIAAASELAEQAGLPLVVVAETWPVGRGRGQRDRLSAAALAGLGARWGRWQLRLEDAGHPRARTLRVTTGTWRRAILGGASQRRSASWKRAAILAVEGRYGVRLGPDAAEAALIATWGVRSPRVAKAAGARARRLGDGTAPARVRCGPLAVDAHAGKDPGR